MRRLSRLLGLATLICLTACSSRVVRPRPGLGTVESVRTRDGEYDGYSVKRRFDAHFPEQGFHGWVELRGHGRRPIVVRERTHRIEGLDYGFMREQGWLFPCKGSGDAWLCRRSGPEVVTASFESVDPLIAYLGQWLEKGGYAGTLSISVWLPRGVPEDVHISFGQHEGYTVAWARGKAFEGRRGIALTGQGSRLFPPLQEGQPEAYEQRGNTAVAIGKSGDQGVGLIDRSQEYPPMSSTSRSCPTRRWTRPLPCGGAASGKATTRERSCSR